MAVPFGPQLIGQTEKTLNALLDRILGDRLTEPQWVTLRVAHQLADQVGGGDDLAREVADRARFGDAAALVESLTAIGLLADGRPTDRGRELIAEILAQTAEAAAPLFADLPEQDVAATERVLNQVLTRTRTLLGGVGDPLPSRP
jgi:hypothetical protein